MSELLPEQLCKPFKAVVFDLDGTLVDSEEIHYWAFKQAMSEFGYDFDATAENIKYEGSFRTLFQQVANTLQFDEDRFNQIYERKLELTLTYPPDEVDFVDGIVSFLELLNDQSIPMAVVTNSDRSYTDHTLQTHDLSDFFQHVITASDVAQVKPHPEGYLRAADLLMLEPADTLVFENSDSGIAAGKAAGMSVIAIRTTDAKGFSTYEEADHGIDTFADTTIDHLQFTTQA